MGGLRPGYLTLPPADLAAAVTIPALLWRGMQFAYRAASLHVMIETTAAMAALIAAYLVYGRYNHSHAASDLLLLAALAFLSVTKFVVAIALVLAIILADISDRLPLGLDPSTADARFPHFAASPALIMMEVAGML